MYNWITKNKKSTFWNLKSYSFIQYTIMTFIKYSELYDIDTVGY